MKIIFTALALLCLAFLCNKKKINESYNYNEYNYTVLDIIKLRLIYENGILQNIKHFNNKELSNNNYAFYKDGSIRRFESVIGDSIIKEITYYQSGQVESISFDLDLNPNDTIFKFHGINKSFYESGNLRQLSKWSRGKMIDTLYLYSESGCLSQMGIYDNNGNCVCFTNYKCNVNFSD